jgi:hypothetical protein
MQQDRIILWALNISGSFHNNTDNLGTPVLMSVKYKTK